MIDFATLQGLTIPEGVVTQITDASGRVLWALATNKPVILEVEKITDDTYAGETAYTGEQFILLDIYPKTNGTVSVTYGGLTKTITDTSGLANPNAQQVYFGTFNGVSDSVTTPERGELTIDGEFNGFATGSYQYGSKTTNVRYCGCITDVIDWCDTTTIHANAFRNCANMDNIDLTGVISVGSSAFTGCTGLVNIHIDDLESWCDILFGGNTANPLQNVNAQLYVNGAAVTIPTLPANAKGTYTFAGYSALTSVVLPSDILSINNGIFHGCENLALTALPNSVTSIGNSAFYGCTGITLSSLPNSVTSIGNSAFYGCTRITLTALPSGITSIGDYAFYGCDSIVGITIPDGVTTIGRAAFAECENLNNVTIPASVKTIEDSAFINSGGGNSQRVYVRATTPPDLGESVFGGGLYRIIVPTGYGDIYKAADGWSEYADRIVEAS